MIIESYDIYMDVDSTSDTYKGTEKITVLGANEPLILNSFNLNIKSIKLNRKNVKFSINAEKEEISISENVDGQAIVKVEFEGKINENLMGLYMANTKKGKIYTTQFEPTQARWAFPCLDNPYYKAKFNISLLIDQELDAISNMPVKFRKVSGHKKLVKFKETPRMSTYLVYIGIGKFEEKSQVLKNKKVILTAPEGTLKSTDFPIDIAKKAIMFYENYFNIKYAMPKMHLIAVPEFAAGAMENWGAITFREVVLLVDEATSNVVKKRVAEVISHEIAHQWFGDLVTMKWWNDLWLNESFATFMAYKVLDNYYPQWDPWAELMLGDTSGALRGDSLKNTHPIDVKVQDPKEITQIFDEISYGKGGSILRMIEAYVGLDNFRDGVRKYLTKFAYSNAEGQDLWNEIETITKQPMSRIMKAWIEKEGYPVISASRDGEQIKIEQTRFLLDGTIKKDCWPVPLTIKRANSSESMLLEEESKNIKSADFIKLNINQTGFYRVKYDSYLFENVIRNKDKLSELDKWGIVNDAFAFLLAGLISKAEYLEKINAFRNETEYLVIKEIESQLSTLLLILDNDAKLTDFAKSYFRTHLDRLEQSLVSENDRILRGSIAFDLCLLDKQFAESMASKFKEFEKSDPDLKNAISQSAAIVFKNLDILMEKYRATDKDEDKMYLIRAMGWLPELELDKVVSLIRNGEIKKQDSTGFYISAAFCPYNRAYILKNFETIVKETLKVFAGTGYTGRLIEVSVPYLGLKKEPEIKNILSKLNDLELKRGIEKGLELLTIYSKLVR
ncbi:MAG: M1 family metallopeptidase [Thermoplasmata archaeon]